MVNVSSIFSQLLKEVPREDFAAIVRQYGAEKHSKGFTSWTQLVSMLFCHLAKAESLREICNGLSCCIGKLLHLGISKSPNKSVLSYANEHRNSDVYKDLFYVLLKRFRESGLLGKGRKPKFKFKNKLLSLDSTLITLCLSLFDWAKYNTAKGGVKVHVLLDHDDYMPAFVCITNGKKADVKIAKKLKLNPGSIVAMDKAYNDYKLFSDWTENGIFFVTRLKEKTLYEVLKTETATRYENILSDEIIKLTGAGKNRCDHELRKIEVEDKENNRTIVLLTNNLELDALTVSEIYRDRWEIELFFKLIKQNLKIKTFIGTTENALKTQIWTAMIALLLVKWLHFLSKAKWSFSNLFSMLRLSLFIYRPLREWIDNPFGLEPPITEMQMSLL